MKNQVVRESAQPDLMGGVTRHHRMRGCERCKELDPRVRLFAFRRHAAIFRHDSAQASHAATHSSMSPTRLQSLAHSAQISAHSLHVCLWWGVLISMKWAEVRHISAQAIMRRKWTGSTCFPPASRQWFMAVDRQTL
jgi:hypothetical protein